MPHAQLAAARSAADQAEVSQQVFFFNVIILYVILL
jgi:hypothetical protein